MGEASLRCPAWNLVGSSCRPPTCDLRSRPAACDLPLVRIAFPVNRPSIAKPHLPSSVAKPFDAVQLRDLYRQYKTIGEGVLDARERVCSSQEFIIGEEDEALEKESATLPGVAEAVG